MTNDKKKPSATSEAAQEIDRTARLIRLGQDSSVARLARAHDESSVGRLARAMENSSIGRLASGIDATGSIRPIAEANKRYENITSQIAPSIRALAEMGAASQSIAEQLKSHRANDETVSMLGPHTPERRPSFDLPKIVNPAVKTNKLLGELNEEIDQVSDLIAQQIEVQNKQVEIVGQLLTAFIEGSRAQDEASREAQQIAKSSLSATRWSMWIAIAALAVSLLLAIAGAVL